MLIIKRIHGVLFPCLARALDRDVDVPDRVTVLLEMGLSTDGCVRRRGNVLPT
jgi:hypothetical protein